MVIESRKLLVFLLPLFMLVSCKEPRERFDFVFSDPISDNDGSTYRFCADFNNPSATYNTAIVCRYSTTIIKGNCLTFDITATSPSGQSYFERVTMPLDKDNTLIRFRHNNGSVADIQWPYRNNIAVSEDTGIWHIDIKVADSSLVKGIYGLGFSYNKHIPDTK